MSMDLPISLQARQTFEKGLLNEIKRQIESKTPFSNPIRIMGHAANLVCVSPNKETISIFEHYLDMLLENPEKQIPQPAETSTNTGVEIPHGVTARLAFGLIRMHEGGIDTLRYPSQRKAYLLCANELTEQLLGDGPMKNLPSLPHIESSRALILLLSNLGGGGNGVSFATMNSVVAAGQVAAYNLAKSYLMDLKEGLYTTKPAVLGVQTLACEALDLAGWEPSIIFSADNQVRKFPRKPAPEELRNQILSFTPTK